MILTPKTGRWVVCAAKPGSGVRHRFVMMSAIKHFADQAGYSTCLLWGRTRGVAFCRFEELFAPVPGIRVVNISAEEAEHLAVLERAGPSIRLGQQRLPVFRAGQGRTPPADRFFAWDLAGGFAVAAMARGLRGVLTANPSGSISHRAGAYVQRFGIEHRLGIRVRVEEHLTRDRKPHRLQPELDDVLKSIIRLPWHLKVFVVTDSQYIQTMLASHFHDTTYMTKEFDLLEKTGAYIQRMDKKAMTTFLEEVTCLCRCPRIINVGGFMNDHTVRRQIVAQP